MKGKGHLSSQLSSLVSNSIKVSKSFNERQSKLKSQDSYKILTQNTNVSFKTNNESLTVVKQHVTACIQNAFLWIWHMH